jgi:hypothetical protein
MSGDGSLLRVVAGHRGYICGPRDVGVTGADLDRLIVRQRDCFAGRGEGLGWLRALGRRRSSGLQFGLQFTPVQPSSPEFSRPA